MILMTQKKTDLKASCCRYLSLSLNVNHLNVNVCLNTTFHQGSKTSKRYGHLHRLMEDERGSPEDVKSGPS